MTKKTKKEVKQSTSKKQKNHKPKELTSTDLPKIYKEFIKELPKEALRMTTTEDKTVLKMYGYQFIVNILNEVVGLDHWQLSLVDDPKQQYVKDHWMVSLFIKLELGNWKEGVFIPISSRISFGSGIHNTVGNALKSALTNAFKKAAAMYGVGKKAYEGLIEDYDIEAPTTTDTIKQVNKIEQPNENQLKVTRSIEEALMKVQDADTLTEVKTLYAQLAEKLNSKQQKYITLLIERIEKRLKPKEKKEKQVKKIKVEKNEIAKQTNDDKVKKVIPEKVDVKEKTN